MEMQQSVPLRGTERYRMKKDTDDYKPSYGNLRVAMPDCSLRILIPLEMHFESNLHSVLFFEKC